MHTMMIVDDSSIIRNRIERCFKESAFKIVAQASNGEEAVALFKTHHPDVITMDLTMPRMDGLACIQNLVALNPEVNILVVSALSDRATALEALEYGACGFICKPFTDDQLVQALEMIIHADELDEP